MGTVQERCDTIIGEGQDFFVTIGGYKKDANDKENHYKFGVHFDLPADVKALPDNPKKLAIIGVKRVVSVSAASLAKKIADGEFTTADAETWQRSFNGDAIYTELAKERERKAPTPSSVTPLIAEARNVLVAVQLQKAGVDPLKATKEQIKAARAEAKEKEKTNHKHWATALVQAEKNLARKPLAGFED